MSTIQHVPVITKAATRPPKKGDYAKKVMEELAAQEAAKAEKPREANKKKTVRVTYPGLEYDAAGNLAKKLKEWPKDFDRKLHLPLKQGDFENEGVWLLDRADRLAVLEKRIRQQALDALNGQSRAVRRTLEKKRKLEAVLEALKESLKEQGHDPDAIGGAA